jgi:cytochrome P450
VRIGPNAVSINTISALREIYANRRANVCKADWYRTIDVSSGAFSTHSEIDRTRHAFRRRVLDHAFSDTALRSAETFIVENVRTWCKVLDSGGGYDGWSEPKNMSVWSTWLNYDIMGDLVFGKRFNCMEGGDHRFVPALMMNCNAFIYPVSPFRDDDGHHHHQTIRELPLISWR